MENPTAAPGDPTGGVHAALSSTRAVKLEPHEWTGYFRSIAVDSEGMMATVGLLAAHPNRNDDLPQRRLRAIGYDQSEDVLVVAVGEATARGPSLRYFVSAPRTIAVAESDHTRAILVDDVSGIQTLIRLIDLYWLRASAPPASLAVVPS